MDLKQIEPNHKSNYIKKQRSDSYLQQGDGDSDCVVFNDHDESIKSQQQTRLIMDKMMFSTAASRSSASVVMVGRDQAKVGWENVNADDDDVGESGGGMLLAKARDLKISRKLASSSSSLSLLSSLSTFIINNRTLKKLTATTNNIGPREKISNGDYSLGASDKQANITTTTTTSDLMFTSQERTKCKNEHVSQTTTGYSDESLRSFRRRNYVPLLIGYFLLALIAQDIVPLGQGKFTPPSLSLYIYIHISIIMI